MDHLRAQLLGLPLVASKLEAMEREQTEAMAAAMAEELALEQEQEEATSVLVQMEGKLMSSFMASMADREAEHVVEVTEMREKYLAVIAQKEIEATRLLQKVIHRLKHEQRAVEVAKQEAGVAREELARIQLQSPDVNRESMSGMQVRLSEGLRKAMNGRKYCSEQLLSREVLLEHLKAKGEIKDVALVEVTVQSMNGSSFAVQLEAGPGARVKILKAEIEMTEGTSRNRQDLLLLDSGAEKGGCEKPLLDDFQIEGGCTVVLCVTNGTCE
jgi:hypothetical protein